MLTQLSIYQLRNLNAIKIEVGQCNMFIGANGSGKTSLLESIYLLSRGKSFRHHQPKRYITHHAPYTTVFAKFTDGSSLAIQKAQDASTILRLSNQTVYVQSALTKLLPTLLIDPSSMDILEVGSSSRRQLLDWITFHVKPGFHPQWLAYQRLLKQRNTLLKQSPSLSAAQKLELAAWDKGLATHADLITHYRRQVFESWQPLFADLIRQLLPAYAPFIQLKFVPGYDVEIPLHQLLQQRLQQDSQTGYTRIGCHRADIQVLWVDNADTRSRALQQPDANDSHQQNTELANRVREPSILTDIDQGESFAKNEQESIDINVLEPLNTSKSDSIQGNVREQAANVLSRGEKKLLITALRLSQLPLLTPDNSPTQLKYLNDDIALPVVLLDDITAELDDRALHIMLKTLARLTCQVFMTSLDESLLKTIKSFWPDAYVFHVKQGLLTLIKE